MEIVSVGMVTAVGLDAASSCAAMRARLDGFQETKFYGAGAEPLIGAPITMPHRWPGERRLAHAAAAAIIEAFGQTPDAWGRTSIILCVAEQERPGRPIADYGRFLHRVSEIVAHPPHLRSRIVAEGRPSGHVALQHARTALINEATPYVMIVGVDSYLTSRSISHYLDQDRLLAGGSPNGFIPGEAAAAVLCARNAGGLLRVTGLGLAREPASIYNKQDLPLRGDGMTSAYRAALDQAGLQLHNVDYRISDLIGEKHWFKQAALASLRLSRGHNEFQDIWSPGESLGNIGAAALPVMIAMAWTAARKHYASGPIVLIEASNDMGACGAAIFAQAGI